MKKDTRDRTVFNTPINPKMGEGRFQDALRRMRKRIAGGIKLGLDDSNVIGNKHTHCSWGMCSEDKEQWPDKDDHIFPDDFEERERIAPREMGKCPLDTRKKNLSWGCFYKCRAFHQKEHGKLTKAKILELFDNCIKKREKKHGYKTTEMDNEPWRQA
jgi:hypothetical protein